MTRRRPVSVRPLPGVLLAAGHLALRHRALSAASHPAATPSAPLPDAQSPGRPRRARPKPAAARRLRGSTRAICAAGAAVLVFGLATGPALGYFTVRGRSGAGSGNTATLQPLVILAATTGTPSSLLTPGATADLLLRVSNPNAAPVTITSVSQGGGVSVSGGSGCTSDPAWPGTLGNSAVSVPTSTGQSIPVAGGATVVVHVPGGASMNTTSASGCQGATFQIPVTVAIRQ